MIRLAVFGQPIAHSLSPRIHRLFAAQHGLEIDYQAIEASRDTFPTRLNELAARGGRGCNVTVPLKRDAWKLAARSSEGAQLAQAANVLVFDDAAGFFADNTDGPGLVSDLQPLLDCRSGSARICLLGAGGAAAGVLQALLKAGPELIVIANRTAERADELIRSHAGLGALDHCTPEEIPDRGPFDVLINATSMGHHGLAPDISDTWLKPGGLCYDLNYGMAAKPLKHACERLGLRYSDGLGMLTAQAALSFRLWTGIMPETAPVLAALREDQENLRARS